VASQPFVIGASDTRLLVAADTLRAEFDQRRSLLCDDVIEPSFLERLLARCRASCFVPDRVEGLGDREVERPQRVSGAINLALGRSPLLRWAEAATGHPALGRAEGRVVRSRANDRDQLDWHDDLDDPSRRLAITINLGEHRYEGGLFELRDKRTKALLITHLHLVPGAALIFDIGYDIEHRVLPVTSGGPRCVYTGWFFKGAQ
jgi:hypothetical protein